MRVVSHLIRVVRALACLAAAATTAAQPASTSSDHVIGLGFVGRVVRDLDKSVEFYKAIGFNQDPAADPAWRSDEVVEHLYGVRGVRTRMAKMYVQNVGSGQRFVVYLRELQGIERKDLSAHTAWDPGVSHFGLVVPDAEHLWSTLQARTRP